MSRIFDLRSMDMAEVFVLDYTSAKRVGTCVRFIKQGGI